MRYGAIEAGGTKFILAVGDSDGKILKRERVETTFPDETLKKVEEFFKNEEIEGLGVGAFGPICFDKKNEKYGYITNTSKREWINYNLLGELEERFNIPIALDTDVNAAALGEIVYGKNNDIDSCLYMTIGSGIGVGAVLHGDTYRGKNHPEMGHIKINRHEIDIFKGICPYHNDCLEGLASGTALKARWGKDGSELPKDHIGWNLEAFYIAQGISNYILTFSPERIFVGGGVMNNKDLLLKIKTLVEKNLNNYVDIGDIDSYILVPTLKDNAGILGALALIKKKLNLKEKKYYF